MCVLPGFQSNCAGVVTLCPSTRISSPAGFVVIVVAVGTVPYSLATPSMSPDDSPSDLTGIPGGMVPNWR